MFVLVSSSRYKQVSEWWPDRVAPRPWSSLTGKGHGKNITDITLLRAACTVIVHSHALLYWMVKTLMKIKLPPILKHYGHKQPKISEVTTLHKRPITILPYILPYYHDAGRRCCIILPILAVFSKYTLPSYNIFVEFSTDLLLVVDFYCVYRLLYIQSS